MTTTPSFPFTSVATISEWFNFHHTITNRVVPLYVTPDAIADADASPPSAVRQAQALNAILSYCEQANPPERLCTLGAKWSMSNVLDPANVVLDPGAFNKLAKVSGAWLTPDYQVDAKSRGGVPVIVQGGTQIGYLNQKLGESGLALATSGANDGHRFAGAIATGTHGSALRVGAIHDTALAIYLVTGPNRAALLQPAKRRFTGDLAAWFERSTSIPTLDLADDDLFHASLVALGSLGFVHSVIVEAVPLYQFVGKVMRFGLDDPTVWHAMETLDTSALDSRPLPDHMHVVLSPYATNSDPGAFVTPSPVTAMAATDTTRILSSLIGRFDNAMSATLVEQILVEQTQAQFTGGEIKPLFPGQMFGPTNLPPGNGRSTEVVVDHKNTVATIRAILAALRSEANAGRHLLGALGVRFVPGTNALLGMNIHSMNTYVEVASIGSSAITTVQKACWTALETAKIGFTCHWGQEYGMDANSVNAWFGDRVSRWKTARAKLLDTAVARTVFSTPLLASVGLS